MAHVITQPCCNDATCVAVCPANCIHPGPDEPDYARAEMLYIDPELCVDCGACIEACPVGAIVPDDELTSRTREFAGLNARYFDAGPGQESRRAPSSLVPGRMRLAEEVAPEPVITTTTLLRVAIVGSGPSGCYAAAEVLARHPGARVTMFERLPTPWGLVRAGVAPDHPETKEVIQLFERTAARPEFTFHLGVEVGRDITHEELSNHHHAVIYAVGASADQRLGIRGEDLPGSHSAAEFVAWYNGSPDARERTFDLSCERAVVIGNGNVALDIARILVADPADLARTDIADHALAQLGAGRIREVVVLGRRGPAQAAYTTPELMALGHLRNADVVVDPAEARPDEVTDLPSGPDGEIARYKVSVVQRFAARRPRHNRRIVLRYLRSPVEILGQEKVRALRVGVNELMDVSGTGRPEAIPTGQFEELTCGLVLRSTGYRGRPVPGLPFDDAAGRLPHRAGRVLDPATGEPVVGAYVAGWIKRGPSGVIGTNKRCAHETVEALLADHATGRLREPALGAEKLDDLVAARRPNAFGYAGWLRLDRYERALGQASHRPRVKLVDAEQMAAVAGDELGGPSQ
ncbi:FAD-dependent oxidoreductase [Nocardia sp. R7R-8]|uniref:FAD-dependent oxidoreductase n=1 Tax=Nocardia sp. R7R-8 TaxID=3459304 RepID=UPI00403DA5F3